MGAILLGIYADFPYALMAECIRASKAKGRSAIAALHHNRSNRGNTSAAAPFDLLYGFQGTEYDVDLHSPFEMFRYWSIERIDASQKSQKKKRAEWTATCQTFMDDELSVKGVQWPKYIAS